MAKASEAEAAAARAQPPRPADWEGAEYDAGTEDAEEASEAAMAAAARVRPPRPGQRPKPVNWESMIKAQRNSWKKDQRHSSKKERQ